MAEFTPGRAPERPSALPAPERASEQLETSAARERAPARESAPQGTPTLPPVASTPAPAKAQQRDIPELQRAIEHVLEGGLESIYRELTAEQQATFRAGGEETAAKIAALMRKVRVKVSEILQLIRAWLTTIPGINRYFLEQEAKIKADKILKLH